MEICVEGFWGTVCDSEWSQREALVVCRQSGFGTRGGDVFHYATLLPSARLLFFQCPQLVWIT